MSEPGVHDSWLVTGPQIIELDDVRALRVALVGGRVDVVGRDQPGARIEVHRVAGRPLEVSLANGELRLGYSFTLGGWDEWLERLRNWRALHAADVHVAVPRDAAVRLSAVTADAFLADVASSHLSTVSGALVADRTRGELSAKSVSGDVVVRGHHGDLRVNSVSGSVTASGTFTQAKAKSVSGAITLDLAQAKDVELQTVSGDLTVRLPADAGVSVSARSVSGRVIVDGAAHSIDGKVVGNIEVQAGDGACQLRTKSVSGNLTVLRGARVDSEVE